jgi:lysophospholipase L1-like esterase
VEAPFTTEDLGEISVEKVMAVGDGFMAGVMDGALYSDGQSNSLAAIFASQFTHLVENEFVQPAVASANGYNLFLPNNTEEWGKWIFQYRHPADENPDFVLTPGEIVKDYPGDKNKISNLAFPGFTVSHLKNNSVDGNPYFTRIFSTGSTGISEQIIRRSPSLLLCWLGMSDFLTFAMHGAVNPGDLTPADTFQIRLNQFFDEILQKTDCKIIIGNLISIQDLPFFYYQPYNGLFLSNLQLSTARARYFAFNEAVAAYNRTVSEEFQRPYIDFFDNGYNLHPQNLVVTDNSLPDAFYPEGKPLEKFRHLTAGEMVLKTVTAPMKQSGFGSSIPLSDSLYLSRQQIETIIQRVNNFNTAIEQIAVANPGRVALADVARRIHPIAESGKLDAWGEPVNKNAGIEYFNGVPIGGTIDMNSVFSLDGIHFNPRGNAFLSNWFISAAIQAFGAKIPAFDINRFQGNVYFPIP